MAEKENVQSEEVECKPEEYFTTEETSGRYKLKRTTLEAWRTRGGGPEYVKFGRAVRYSRSALEEGEARSARRSSSE